MTPPQPGASRPEADVAVTYESPAGVLGVLAAVLYVVSFFLPACEGAAGYQAFALSLVCVVGIPMWLANPLFWSGLLLLSQGKRAAAGKAGLTAVALALSQCWLFWPGLRVGYFAWVGSMGLLAVAGWCGGQERQAAVPESRGAGEASRIAARFRSAGRVRQPWQPACNSFRAGYDGTR
jgi:hypothetical protein